MHPFLKLFQILFRRMQGRKSLLLLLIISRFNQPWGNVKPSWILNNYNKGATIIKAPGWQGFGPVSFTAGFLVPRTVPGTQ